MPQYICDYDDDYFYGLEQAARAADYASSKWEQERDRQAAAREHEYVAPATIGNTDSVNVGDPVQSKE